MAGDSDRVDDLITDLQTYTAIDGHPSAKMLRSYAISSEAADSVNELDGRPLCPYCADDLETDGTINGLYRDPYCTVTTDLDDLPAQYRPDREAKHREFVAVFCQDHLDGTLIALQADWYDDDHWLTG